MSTVAILLRIIPYKYYHELRVRPVYKPDHV
jgi:hypothetical protein